MINDFEIAHSEPATLETLAHIVDNVPMACVLWDNQFNVAHLNVLVAELFALRSKDDFIQEELSPPFQPDGSPSKSKAFTLRRDCLESGRVVTYDWLHCRRDKVLVPTINTLIRVSVVNGHQIMEFIQDLRDTAKARTAEREARRRLQAMMDSCPIACGLVDKHFNVLEANEEVKNLFGLYDKSVFTDRFFELSPEYQPDGRLSRQKALDKLKQAFEAGRANYEWLHQNIKAEHIPCEITLVKVRLDEQDQAILYIHDLRETKKSMAMLEKMESIAYTDEMTKLFSRRYFIENAEKTFEKCKENSEPFHLIMADLDHFKNVNDTYGHPIGDEVLKIAAARMGNVTRKGTILARYGGEEFIVLLTDMSYDAAVKTAKRMQKVIEESRFMIKGLGIDVTISLGVATFSEPNETLNDIICMADVALYAAKRSGRNKVVEYKDAREVEGLNWV